MAYTAQLTDAARDYHERMFPGYVSDFLRTDPEFIERFDNFAFDEVSLTTARASCAGWPRFWDARASTSFAAWRLRLSAWGLSPWP